MDRFAIQGLVDERMRDSGVVKRYVPEVLSGGRSTRSPKVKTMLQKPC